MSIAEVGNCFIGIRELGVQHSVHDGFLVNHYRADRRPTPRKALASMCRERINVKRVHLDRSQEWRAYQTLLTGVAAQRQRGSEHCIPEQIRSHARWSNALERPMTDVSVIVPCPPGSPQHMEEKKWLRSQRQWCWGSSSTNLPWGSQHVWDPARSAQLPIRGLRLVGHAMLLRGRNL